MTQAIARVFARLGEKKNRNRARLKFLVAKLGIEEFRQLVEEELKIVPPDPRHTDYIPGVGDFINAPAKPGMALNGTPLPDGFAEWYRTNVYKQVQPGYSTITLNTPLGDFTSEQGFKLADIARKYVGDNIRLSVEQNIVLRWVADADCPPSTAISAPSTWAMPTPTPSSISPPAPAPIPASSASPLRAA